MGCPHSLDDYQIETLDCNAIFPVVQWLVNRIRLRLSDDEVTFSSAQLTLTNTCIPYCNWSIKWEPSKLAYFQLIRIMRDKKLKASLFQKLKLKLFEIKLRKKSSVGPTNGI